MWLSPAGLPVPPPSAAAPFAFADASKGLGEVSRPSSRASTVSVKSEHVNREVNMLQWEVQHLKNMMHQGLSEEELAEEMARIRQRVGGLMGNVDKAERREKEKMEPEDPQDTGIRPYPLTPSTGTSQANPIVIDRTISSSQSQGTTRGVEGQGCAEYPLNDSEGRLAYVGQFNSKGERHGHGVLWWRNGDCYEGQWRNDKPNGYGSEVYHDGSFYEGEWYKDDRQGVGVFTHANGNSYAGNWTEGELQGLALVSRPSSDGTAQQQWSRCISGHVMPDWPDTPSDEYDAVLRALDQVLSIAASHIQIARKMVKQVKGEDKVEAAMELQARLRQRWDRERGEEVQAQRHAAVLLQLAMRARRARQAMQARRAEIERKKDVLHFAEAAGVIQKRLRGIAGRKQTRNMQRDRELARAAVLVQAGLRGMAGRREAEGRRRARDFGEEYDPGDPSEIEAAIAKDPSVFEKLTGTADEAEEVREEVLGHEMNLLDAAFVLQRRARGNQARKKAEELRLQRDQSKLDQAATLIQKRARGMAGRAGARERREAELLELSLGSAAVLIQKRLRGMRGRLWAEARRQEVLQEELELQAAATIIQRRVRGIAGRARARRRSAEHHISLELDRLQAIDAACSLQAAVRRWRAAGAFQLERQRAPLYRHASAPKEITRTNSQRSSKSTRGPKTTPSPKTEEQILDEIREYLAGVATAQAEPRRERVPKPPPAKREAAKREADKDHSLVRSVRIVEPLVKFSPLLANDPPPSFRAAGRPHPRSRFKIKTIPEHAPKKQDLRLPSPVVLSPEASLTVSASDVQRDESFESEETTSQEQRLRVQQSMKELMLRQELSWKSRRRNKALKAQQGRLHRKATDQQYADHADVLLGQLSSQIQSRLVWLDSEGSNPVEGESEIDSEAMSDISRMSRL